MNIEQAKILIKQMELVVDVAEGQSIVLEELVNQGVFASASVEVEFAKDEIKLFIQPIQTLEYITMTLEVT